jgi:hypothetical protein
MLSEVGVIEAGDCAIKIAAQGVQVILSVVVKNGLYSRCSYSATGLLRLFPRHLNIFASPPDSES